ncbi:type III-B CRISPR module RAMP protein Cmr4 [Halonatronum saccharophilum]|uniref:type III-B CRISPR module RAMP protein Cmr4 n=1 Tax=Halonatronum saccharophilum TaxID=150060 RepID=UPI0004BA5D4D|nr:type III-B CRISPR module RAMP protein Cmr4 [Halonatronum saccharophilum]
MNKKKVLYKVLSPLHMGSGSELGIVDLPIQRERHTAFPKMEASSIKGSIKHYLKRNIDEIENLSNEEQVEKLLGADEDVKSISEIGISDAKILFYPISSAKGVFAYITCPYILNNIGVTVELEDKDGQVFSKSKVEDGGSVILENYKLNVSQINDEDNILNGLKGLIKEEMLNEIKERLVVIKNEYFKTLVLSTTEVNTRIKIDDDGLVDKETGGLFTVEYLPRETVFYGEIFKIRGNNELDKFTKIIGGKTIQFGGDKSLGKGFVKLKVVDES